MKFIDRHWAALCIVLTLLMLTAVVTGHPSFILANR